MDDAPQPFTAEQFTAAMLESAHLHTDIQWVLARTRSGEPLSWLGGFGDFAAKYPVWVTSVDEAATYDRDGAERARLRCTDLPDHDDVLYAVCHLKAGETPPPSAERQPPKGLSPSTEAWLQSAIDAGNRADRDPEFAKKVGKRVP